MPLMPPDEAVENPRSPFVTVGNRRRPPFVAVFDGR